MEQKHLFKVELTMKPFRFKIIAGNLDYVSHGSITCDGFDYKLSYSSFESQTTSINPCYSLTEVEL